MSQQEEAEKPWQQEKNQYFVGELNKEVWKIDSKLDILVLKATCPFCDHSDGINAIVPTRIARFRGADQKRTQFVECKCVEPHPGRPAGQLGCGRWGMITIRETGG